MKIIKKNKKHLWVECKHCGSILEPSPKDIEEWSEIRALESCIMPVNGVEHIKIVKHTTQWIVCPVCGKNITIKKENNGFYIPYEEYLKENN